MSAFATITAFGKKIRLRVFGPGRAGVVPAAGAEPSSAKSLREDGTWSSAGGGAPTDADYLVKTANGGLSAERVVTDTLSVVWDWATGGQAKATVPASSGSALGTMSAAHFTKLAALADYAFAGTAQTTDATVTTCGSFTVTDGTTAVITATVSGHKSDHAQGLGYVLVGAFRRSGGTVTQIGLTTEVVLVKDDILWSATFDVSGTDVRVRVNGVAATTVAWRTTAVVTVA